MKPPEWSCHDFHDALHKAALRLENAEFNFYEKQTYARARDPKGLLRNWDEAKGAASARIDKLKAAYAKLLAELRQKGC